MKKIITNLILSFDNRNEGFSGKKLSAFVVMLCIVTMHIFWLIKGDFTHFETILIEDFSFVCVLYGVNVADKKLNNNE